jgi:hypothetical protein
MNPSSAKSIARLALRLRGAGVEYSMTGNAGRGVSCGSICSGASRTSGCYRILRVRQEFEIGRADYPRGVALVGNVTVIRSTTLP